MKQKTASIVARSGYAARGVVYLIIGGLAVQTAAGTGGQTTGSRGAIRELLTQPLGQVLVAIVGAGLLAYALWRAIQSVSDVDHHGTDAKGLAIRGGMFASAVSHTLLAFYALALVFTGIGGSSSGGGDSTEAWTAQILRQPFGQWLVGIIGAIVIVVGVAHAIKAWKTEFERYLDMTEQQMKIGRPIAVFGLVARGFVFVIIGSFLIVAAYQAQPQEAKSLGETLMALRQQAYGPWLLGVVALGLMSFGAYSIIEAAFRHIEAPRASSAEPAPQRSQRAGATATRLPRRH